MTFAIVLSRHAASDLESLPEKIHKQVIQDIKTLEVNPMPDGKRVKKLKGLKKPLFRLRSGDYRVIFQLWKQIVVIVRVLPRKNAYRF